MLHSQGTAVGVVCETRELPNPVSLLGFVGPFPSSHSNGWRTRKKKCSLRSSCSPTFQSYMNQFVSEWTKWNSVLSLIHRQVWLRGLVLDHCQWLCTRVQNSSATLFERFCIVTKVQHLSRSWSRWLCKSHPLYMGVSQACNEFWAKLAPCGKQMDVEKDGSSFFRSNWSCTRLNFSCLRVWGYLSDLLPKEMKDQTCKPI